MTELPQERFRYELDVRALVVSLDVARAVRSLRIDRDLTWRSVEEEARLLLGFQLGEGDPQSVGFALCQVAAEVLGEDPEADPWS